MFGGFSIIHLGHLMNPYDLLLKMTFSNSKIIARFRSAAPWALRHLIISAVIGGLVALLILGLWFPQPYLDISGGWKLFFLIMFVDVVCGPTLTLLLIHPEKTRKAIWVDVALIFFVQIGALGYGVHSLSEARPVALLFEVDRFRVVSYADIDTSQPEAVPDWVGAMRFEPPRILGIRNARNPQEKAESVDASLQGVEPGQRPGWWQAYELSVPQVKSRAMPLDMLLALNPQLTERIRRSAAQATEKTDGQKEALKPEELLWLPVVSRMSMNWVAFVDPRSGAIRGYVEADGFGP